ncbi:MAG TPA: DUF1302 family protein [Chitinivibrionales bacterium]|nr:DUF1302 family protein [Chitinivibrionales bacterium]
MLKQCLVMSMIMVVSIFIPARAQEETTPLTLSWNGYILADDRAHVSGVYDMAWQEYRLDLKSEVKAFGKAKFASDLWIRSLGFPSPATIADLQNTGTVSPLNISLREGYVDLYGLGLKDLDVTVGRQRIAWGTADKINPTDVINPYDLEDIWDFGRHLGSDGIKAVYYIGNFSITGVFVPLFKPDVLPFGNYVNVFMPSVGTIPFVNIKNLRDTVIMPPLTLRDNAIGGIKFGGRVAGVDFSVSYAYFRDGLPIAGGLTLVPEATNLSDLTADYMRDSLIDIKEATIRLEYPRLHMAGVDFSSAIAKVGVWGELAVFFPEKRTDMAVTFGGNDTLAQFLSGMAAASGLTSSLPPALDNKPYVKFVVGIDYTFPADIYINAQYIHGFIHERGDSIEDYLMANLDWNLLNDKLKLTPIGVGLEIKNFSKIADNYAVVGQPQVTWYPIDNAEIALGARLIDGKNGTYFGKIKNDDEVFARVKYSF